MPPLHQPYSLLALSNNTSIVPTLTAARDRCVQLYRVRAHAHHYTAYMDAGVIDGALEALAQLTASYADGACLSRRVSRGAAAAAFFHAA